MCLRRQFTCIYLQYAISCNKFKARCLWWSGVHFIVTVTTVTVITRCIGVGFISFVACEAIVLFYTIHYLYFATSAENICGRDDCDGGAGSGGGGGGVSLLFTGFDVIGSFRFAGFLSSSGNCCP